MAAQRILKECGLTRAQLARDSGLNEGTLWAWLNGRRTPGPESLLKLADGLEKRGSRLAALAQELRKEAGE